MKLENNVRAQKEYFGTNITKSLSFRKEQLKKLSEAIEEYTPTILRALKEDLNKSEYEAYLTEITMVKTEIRTAIKKLSKWAKPARKRKDLTIFPAKAFSVYEPYGVVLILAPWNYPFQLAMSPLIGALAAGNCVLLKTSRNAPNTGAVIADMIHATFDPRYVATVDDRASYDAILSQKYDYIFFTGSPRVGRIVMRSASESLTPITLELGGKSPCIVERSADLKDTAKKIIWGKILNAGQTCVAPDYVLVEECIKEKLLQQLQKEIETKYHNQLLNPDYPRIVNLHHFMRLKRLIEKEREVIGGETDERRLRIAPAIIPNADFGSECMKEEIFGPILPILSYTRIEDALEELKNRPKPLACYVFTGKRSFADRIIGEYSYGGGCVNDCIMHVAAHRLPFGGVGNSGMGSYHSEHSFRTFSHEKGIVYNHINWSNPLRFPPFKEGKLKFFKKIMKV